MNYYSVLEKNIQIQLMILENLYHAQTCCTLEELSQSTNSDKRSILNYCEYIKELSKHKVKKEDKGYIFKGTVVDYQLLLLKILECSAIFQLIKKVCFQPKVDLHEFSYEYNVSVPSLRRHITRVNQLLEKYHLQLKTSKGAVYIKGNELHVRYLIYLILWQSYQGVIWPFSTIDFQELFSGIEYAFQLTRQKPNKIKMIEWCYIIAITLLRSEQGNSINKTDLPEFTEDLWENFGDITKKLQRMSEKAEINLEEMKFLFLWLQTRSAFYLKENHLDQAIKIHLHHGTPIKQFQNSFYTYIYSIGFKSSQINLKKRLLNSTILANGMCGILFPQFSTIKQDFTSIVETRYPTFNREIAKLTEQIKNQYQNLDWVSPWHLIEAFMIVSSPTYFDKEIKIKFESDLPLSIELNYMSSLQEQLRMYINVLFTNDLLFEPDLIIRTTDMPFKVVTYEETIPCLIVPTEMSSEKIYALSQQIKKLIIPSDEN